MVLCLLCRAMLYCVKLYCYLYVYIYTHTDTCYKKIHALSSISTLLYSACLSIYLSIYLPINVSICLGSCNFLSIRLTAYRFLFISSSIHRSIYPSISLPLNFASVSLSFYLGISVCVCAFLSLFQSQSLSLSACVCA